MPGHLEFLRGASFIDNAGRTGYKHRSAEDGDGNPDPVAPVELPTVATKRTATATVGTEDTHVTVSASGIRSNGRLEPA